MSVTSKSPLDVLVVAWGVAKRALPPHAHRNSPKKFTQHQLFACLVLKNFLRTDYRGVVQQLWDCPSLMDAIELDQVPHYTTLQKSARRLLNSAEAQRLLDETVAQQMGRRKRIADVAIDSTEFRARGLTWTSFKGSSVRPRNAFACIAFWRTQATTANRIISSHARSYACERSSQPSTDALPKNQLLADTAG